MYDRRRFSQNYAGAKRNRRDQTSLEGRINFHAHALEKGLSHDTIRYHFGVAALQALSASMETFRNSGFDTQSLAYVNGLSVLREYIAVHEDAGQSVEHLGGLLTPLLLQGSRECDAQVGGTVQVLGQDKIDNRDKNFKDLFVNRWSVREYANTPVAKELIEEAISIATKSPSVCNRQSGRVRIISDPELIASTLQIQGGFNGYALPPVLLVVTTDTSSFLHKNERNQAYIDGGLFAMSLLLTLEYVSLAACPLNAMLSVANEKAMRKLLSLPDRENIIFFISVGNFQDANLVPKSFRYPSEHITL